MAGLLGDNRRGGGLLGDVLQGDQKAAASLMALPEPQKAGLVDYALATLAGGGLAGAAALGLQQRNQRRAYAGQQQRMAQLTEQGQAAGLTAAERLAFSVDPAKALEMIAKRNEPMQITAGNTRYENGQTYFAPKVGVDGGFGYSQTPDKITWQDQRGINHQEIETERHNLQGEESDEARLKETIRSNQAGEGIARGQLDVSRGHLGVAQGNLALGRQKAGQDTKAATEAQATAGFNASRLLNASRNLGRLEKSGFDAGWGAGNGLAGGFDKNRSYRQAANEWADALIRNTTGAAATKEEIDQAWKTYFPQFGDAPEIRQQKAQARAAVEGQAVRRAGPSLPQAAPDPLGIR